MIIIENLSGGWTLIKFDDIEVNIKGNPFYEDVPLAEIFLSNSMNWNSIDEISQWAKNLKGSFLIIIKDKEKVVVISDIIRTFPLFYKLSKQGIYVSDDIRSFGILKLDKYKAYEYICFGFSMENSTVFSDVLSLQAAEILFFTNSVIKSQRYFQFFPETERKLNKSPEFVNDFNQRMQRSFHRILKSVHSINNWIIPLSGGHDSRILVNCLYKAGIKDVICFSYGTPGNPQTEISKRVAGAVGYDWYFIEYTENKWGNLHENGVFDQYIDFAFQGVSTPHLLDFLAVYELKSKGIIKEGDVFLPGHALDFIAGSHLLELDLNCRTKEDAILRALKKFSRTSNPTTEAVAAYSILYEDSECSEPQFFQEYCNWQERQAKLIVNSCRVYEFFGFEFRLPFWDRNLVDFFLHLQITQRENRNLFLSCEREGILLEKLAIIPFADELITKKIRDSLKNIIRRLMPNSLKVKLLRLTRKKEKLAEGLNLIYTQKADTVEELIGGLDIFPEETHHFIKPHLKRYPFQMDYNFLTALYTFKRMRDQL